VDLAGSERSLSSALGAAPFQALICSIQGLLTLLASVASCFSLSFFLVWILQSSVGWVVLKKCSFIVPSLYYVSIIAAEIVLLLDLNWIWVFCSQAKNLRCRR